MSETRTCEYCGKAMTRPPRMPESLWAKRRWCDRACMTAARAPKEQVCERCGKVYRPRQTRKRGHKFCSVQCANAGRPIKGPYRKMRDGERVRTVHRVTKEREIRRALTAQEIVHHQDEDKLNNDPANLEVMSNAEHSRIHMIGNRNAARSPQ